MSIRVLRRKPVRFRVIRGRSLLRVALFILAAGLLFRLFSISRLGARVEQWMLSAGRSESFVSAAMRFELTSLPASLPDWTDTLSGQSAALAAYEPQVRAAMAMADEAPAPTPTPNAPGPVTTEPPSEAPALFAAEGFEPPEFVPPLPTFPVQNPSSPSPSPTVSLPPPDSVREITFAPSSPDGYDAAQGVFVKNETSLSVNVADLLKKKPAVKLAKSGPQILIVHTHGSEAFLPDEEFPYAPTDVERTEDTKFNVVRVGDEMQKVFEAQGLKVVHDRNIYDEPTYTGSYGRSLTAIKNALKQNPGISMVIDVHRDSIQIDGKTYKAVTEADGQKAAQLMLVIGTNDSGLDHPEWKQNLILALQLQKKLNKDYPKLMRPINLRKERFNEHATTGSLLLEVGASGNTLGEAIISAKIFAQETGAYLKGLQ